MSERDEERRRHIEGSLARGPVEIRTRGIAMRPLLRPGDRVRLERRAPRRGDVALIALAERMVLHRLVRRRGETWLVRGDAPGPSEAWVHRDQVVAVATARRREGRGRARWLRLDHPVARAGGLAAGHARWASRGLRPSPPGD